MKRLKLNLFLLIAYPTYWSGWCTSRYLFWKAYSLFSYFFYSHSQPNIFFHSDRADTLVFELLPVHLFIDQYSIFHRLIWFIDLNLYFMMLSYSSIFYWFHFSLCCICCTFRWTDALLVARLRAFLKGLGQDKTTRKTGILL